jgi:hypothetical protein
MTFNEFKNTLSLLKSPDCDCVELGKSIFLLDNIFVKDLDWLFIGFEINKMFRLVKTNLYEQWLLLYRGNIITEELLFNFLYKNDQS